MNPGRAPNHRLKVDHQIRQGADYVTILAGSFIRPVNFEYLPVHLKSVPEFKFMNSERDAACYTCFGFQVIARIKFEEVW